ncbi:hypothetical protein IC757_11910 [Wenzhouxiangella sp. AB-CW3]|uniref:hypothetical protein n=1 Tax=Wenzhouxiangella sp. AB-CW3 TaxID=2771012 RepID=UPI00168B1AC2|nr:hypothetical protein [Wenzhouxiangella sp. AB-CW3]QOC21742.1 hypothetical protein IC757_11910 [Wenzhouxiangella sp. AB-CW3]
MQWFLTSGGIRSCRVLLMLISLLLSIHSLASQTGEDSYSLETTTPDNGSGGIYLELTSRDNHIAIGSFDIYLEASAGTVLPVHVYTRSGSYQGHELNADSWELLGIMDTEVASDHTPVTVSLPEPVRMPPRDTRAFHLLAVSASIQEGIRYTGTVFEHPTTQYENAHLQLFSELGTIATQPFQDRLFSPRTFSGAVHYRVLPHTIFRSRFEDEENSH